MQTPPRARIWLTPAAPRALAAAPNAHRAEFWSARALQSLLGYSRWRRFEEAIARAKISCETSGNNPEYHFAGAGKMIAIGKSAQRETGDFHLSRFACYLIAQNGDPRKAEIANAQRYFAIQARRQELSDRLAADIERLELRKQTAEEFKALSGPARQAGVENRMFGLFHDAGYKGLYGGLGVDQIKARKSIPAKDALMDRMEASELAANQFRMTQTRDNSLATRLATNNRLSEPTNTLAKRFETRSSGLAAICPKLFRLPNTSSPSRNASGRRP
jgi:DNA-damage-inducible protein D